VKWVSERLVPRVGYVSLDRDSRVAQHPMALLKGAPGQVSQGSLKSVPLLAVMRGVPVANVCHQPHHTYGLASEILLPIAN
jgi:hypothetical protein